MLYAAISDPRRNCKGLLIRRRLSERKSITARINYLEISHPVRPLSQVTRSGVAALKFCEIRINAPELNICHGRAAALGWKRDQIHADRITAYVRMSGWVAPFPPQLKSKPVSYTHLTLPTKRIV